MSAFSILLRLNSEFASHVLPVLLNTTSCISSFGQLRIFTYLMEYIYTCKKQNAKCGDISYS